MANDFALDADQEPALFSQLAVADQEWLPRAVPIPGGGTRYTYKRLSGEAPLNLAQVKALIENPPSFDQERRVIKRLLHQLRLVGARVVLGPPRKQGAAGEWEPRKRVLRIRPDIPSKGSREFVRVLNHEAIHVAQSCHNGGVQALPVVLGLPRELTTREQRILQAPIYQNVTPVERALEEEAYANQQQLSLGMQLLQQNCKQR